MCTTRSLKLPWLLLICMVPSRECIILTRLRNLYYRFIIAHASKVTKVVWLVDHLGFIYINGIEHLIYHKAWISMHGLVGPSYSCKAISRVPFAPLLPRAPLLPYIIYLCHPIPTGHPSSHFLPQSSHPGGSIPTLFPVPILHSSSIQSIV